MSNRAKILRGIERAAREKAAIVSFPENAVFLGSKLPGKDLAVAVTVGTSPLEEDTTLGLICKAAKQHGIHVNVGVLEHPDSNDAGAADGKEKTKFFNTQVWISNEGIILDKYRKIHLFDHPMTGLRESDNVAPGDRVVSIACAGTEAVCGLTICYDVRFPYLYAQLRDRGCNVLFVPAAFTVPTGQAHWRSLLVARAIETQCYVVAAAQWGVHNDKRVSWGESMIVDPWGRVVACASDADEQLIVHDMDFDLIESIRNKMPVVMHKRNI